MTEKSHGSPSWVQFIKEQNLLSLEMALSLDVFLWPQVARNSLH